MTLLLVCLPAWVGGAGIDAAPRPDELGRVVQGLHPDRAPPPVSQPARSFYGAALPAVPATEDPALLLPRARLASVGCLLAISGLLYLTLMVARRRTTGLVACLVLALLPPVLRDGSVLRPELPAAVFAGLATLLIVGYPHLLRRRSRTVPWLSWLASGLAVGAALGLAMACAPSTGVFLLIPGFGMLLTVAALTRTALRQLRQLRRSVAPRFPVAAVPRRVLPWLVLTLLAMAVSAALFSASVQGDAGELRPTSTDAGLLPANAVGAAAVVVLAVLGAVRLLVGVGLRIGRRHRVTPDALLLIYVSTLVLQRMMIADCSVDALIAAPAAAVLVAEGGMAVLLALRARLR